MENNKGFNQISYRNAQKRVEEIKNYILFVLAYIVVVAFLLLSNFTQKLGIENEHRNFFIILQGIVMVGYGFYIFFPKFKNWEQKKILEIMEKQQRNND